MDEKEWAERHNCIKIMNHELYPHICCCVSHPSLPSLWGSLSFQLRTLIGSHPIVINQSQITCLTSSTFCPLPQVLRFFLPSLHSLRSLFHFLSCRRPVSLVLFPSYTLTLDFPFFPFSRCPLFLIPLPLSSSLVSWHSPPSLHPSFIPPNQLLPQSLPSFSHVMVWWVSLSLLHPHTQSASHVGCWGQVFFNGRVCTKKSAFEYSAPL